MTEAWRTVVSNPSYEVSDHGRVRRSSDGHILTQRISPSRNTAVVTMSWASGRRSSEAVHRLVLDAFVGPQTRKFRYRWLDSNKNNNALLNLERLRVRCNRCGVQLTSENAYTRTDKGEPGLRSPCRSCVERTRRQRHDRVENARRAGLPDECEICDRTETVTRGGRVRRPTIDHNHATGQIRGTLCARCNAAIGLMFDDPEIMRRAAAYVEKYERLATLHEEEAVA